MTPGVCAAQSCDLVRGTCKRDVQNSVIGAKPRAGTVLASQKAVVERFANIALCLILFVPDVSAQSARELNDAGWKMLDSGDVDRASRLFAAGLASEPDQPALLLGAGVAAHLLGRSKEATVPLRRALDLDPRLTPASILLGQIVYSDGNIVDAIKIYEQALTHAPNHPHLTAKLMAWRADAEATSGFTERRFDRFR